MNPYTGIWLIAGLLAFWILYVSSGRDIEFPAIITSVGLCVVFGPITLALVLLMCSEEITKVLNKPIKWRNK